MSSDWNSSLVNASSDLTFDLSFWTEIKIVKRYYDCRHELFLLQEGHNKTLLELQSQSNIEYIATKCVQAKVLRDLLCIVSFSIGLPANALALLALVTLRPRSIGLFYIAVLTAADLASIVLRFVDYLMVEKEVFTHRYLCGLRATLVNFFPCYANWLLVLIVFERFYTLRFPLHKTAYFTFWRAKILITGVALVLLIYFLPRTFMSVNAMGGVCVFKAPFSPDTVVKVDNVLIFYAPVILIFLFVGLIAHALLKAQQSREKMFSGSITQARPEDPSTQRLSTVTEGSASTSRQGSEVPLNDHTSRMLRQQRNSERTLTIMMFCAAMFFVVMTLPFIVVMHTKPDIYIGLAQFEFKFHAVLVRGLSMFTHAANFFLYFLTCRRMRSHLYEILRLNKLRNICRREDNGRSIYTLHETELSKLN